MSKRIGFICLTMSAAFGGCAANEPAPAARNDGPVAPAPARAAETSRSLPSDGVYVAGAVPPGAAEKVVGQPVMSGTLAGSQPIARITTPTGERVVTADRVYRPLLESHGLTVLLQQVQLELVKDRAEASRIRLSPEDLKLERERTLGKLYEQTDSQHDAAIDKARKANKPDEVARHEKARLADRQLLLSKFMEQQRISPAELELLLETNGYLRKVAEPEVKAGITEELLRQEFGLKYGEKAKVKHIELTRVQDAAEALRRLNAGEPFEKVARELSANKATAALDGDVPEFTQDNPNLPKSFRDASFGLKPGQVSEIVAVGDTFHLIKLVERRAPEAVKFEDVRDSIARDVLDRATLMRMGQIRESFGEAVRKSLRIEDPVLAAQFQKKLDEANKRADTERILADVQRQNPGELGPQKPEPATKPGAPATAPSGDAPDFGAPAAPGAAAPANGGPAAPANGAPAAPATKPAGAN